MGLSACLTVWDGNPTVNDMLKKEWQQGHPLVVIYSHYGGYPWDFIPHLYTFLNNGYIHYRTQHRNPPLGFNGMGCLAAYIVSRLKDGWGGVYLYPITSSYSGDFNYCLYPAEDGEVHILISHDIVRDSVLYDGTLHGIDVHAIYEDYMGEPWAE